MAKTKVMNCLARTSMGWFKFIINNQLNDFANFWKPCEQKFHVLDKNGKMYLYDSNSKSFIGVAVFTGTSMVKDVVTAWKDYAIRNGQLTLQSFKDLLSEESNTGKKFDNNDKICCIEVVDVKEFKMPMPYDYNKQQMFKKLFTDADGIKHLDNMNDYNDLIKELEARETK